MRLNEFLNMISLTDNLFVQSPWQNLWGEFTSHTCGWKILTRSISVFYSLIKHEKKKQLLQCSENLILDLILQRIAIINYVHNNIPSNNTTFRKNVLEVTTIQFDIFHIFWIAWKTLFCVIWCYIFIFSSLKKNKLNSFW